MGRLYLIHLCLVSAGGLFVVVLSFLQLTGLVIVPEAICSTLSMIACCSWPALWLPQIYKNWQDKSTDGCDRTYLRLNFVANILDNICYRQLGYDGQYQISAAFVFLALAVML